MEVAAASNGCCIAVCPKTLWLAPPCDGTSADFTEAPVSSGGPLASGLISLSFPFYDKDNTSAHSHKAAGSQVTATLSVSDAAVGTHSQVYLVWVLTLIAMWIRLVGGLVRDFVLYIPICGVGYTTDLVWEFVCSEVLYTYTASAEPLSHIPSLLFTFYFEIGSL